MEPSCFAAIFLKQLLQVFDRSVQFSHQDSVCLLTFFCPKKSQYCLLFSQTNQSVFIKLLQSSFRLYNCTWINSAQKANIESCIKTLADVGECRLCCPTFNSFSNGDSFQIKYVIYSSIYSILFSVLIPNNGCFIFKSSNR